MAPQNSTTEQRRSHQSNNNIDELWAANNKKMLSDSKTATQSSTTSSSSNESSSSSTAAGKTFPLTGVERFFTMDANASSIIASTVTVRGDITFLVEHLVEAACRVFNVHPKMRTKILNNTRPLTAEVCSPLTKEEVERVVHIHFDRKEGEEHSTAWRSFMEVEANKAIDRTKELPYYIHLFVDSTSSYGSFARLCLFSDHYISDAYSHTVIINSLFENITYFSSRRHLSANLSNANHDEDDHEKEGVIDAHSILSESYDEEREIFEDEELPLRPGLYEYLLGPGKRVFWGLLSRQRLARWLEIALNRITSQSPPLLPVDNSLKDFYLPHPPRNPSEFMFASGSKEKLQRALKKCKEESVTMHGALVTAISIALGITVHQGSLESLQDCVLYSKMNAAYNMRKRVAPEIKEPHVGLFITTNTLPFLEKQGINTSSRFWDVARRAKVETEKAANTIMTRFTLILAHERLNGEVSDSSIYIPKSVGGLDWTLSNLGRYEFPVNHVVGHKKEKQLKLETFHFGSSNPHMSAGVCFYISALDGLHHCMQPKLESDVSNRLFFWYLRCVDAIGDIPADDTIMDVCRRVSAA